MFQFILKIFISDYLIISGHEKKLKITIFRHGFNVILFQTCTQHGNLGLNLPQIWRNWSGWHRVPGPRVSSPGHSCHLVTAAPMLGWRPEILNQLHKLLYQWLCHHKMTLATVIRMFNNGDMIVDSFDKAFAINY